MPPTPILPLYFPFVQFSRFTRTDAHKLSPIFKGDVVFVDEFCSQLDRITAAVISYNVCRYAKKHNVTFVLASSHDDILADLQPDTLIIKHLSGPAEVIYKEKR